MAGVELKNITKVFPGGVYAVDNFNLKVEDKEFLVLVGASGCGKSTILRMIAGLEEITEGQVYIEGELCNEVNPKDRDIAMVFQSYALYPHMTVRQNLEFGLKLSRKFSRKEIDIRVEETAEILEIAELLDRKPRQLSGGQRQRVALGRAIVRKPRVFLFDEPLSNLDAKMRIQMRVEIGKLHARLQTTMIYVTHDQTEAMTMGDRIVCMKEGRIQQVAAPMELYLSPANEYVASFIGTPPMNFIDCTVGKNGRLHIEGTDDSFKLQKKEQNILEGLTSVRIGIRPENLLLSADNDDALLVQVEVTEPLGAEVLIYANSGPINVVFKADPSNVPGVGESVYLKPMDHKIHFFDSMTRQRIG
jgi:multiple sugar transport system ATP-binding protein